MLPRRLTFTHAPACPAIWKAVQPAVLRCQRNPSYAMGRRNRPQSHRERAGIACTWGMRLPGARHSKELPAGRAPLGGGDGAASPMRDLITSHAKAQHGPGEGEAALSRRGGGPIGAPWRSARAVRGPRAAGGTSAVDGAATALGGTGDGCRRRPAEAGQAHMAARGPMGHGPLTRGCPLIIDPDLKQQDAMWGSRPSDTLASSPQWVRVCGARAAGVGSVPGGFSDMHSYPLQGQALDSVAKLLSDEVPPRATSAPPHLDARWAPVSGLPGARLASWPPRAPP